MNYIKTPENTTIGSIVSHSERCRRCKESVRKMLEKIFGDVEENYQFDIGVLPDDFMQTHYYKYLKEVFAKLKAQRGFQSIVKAGKLPKCDFFVKKPGFILEFDESQHFTTPRRMTLQCYPENLKLGFGKNRWIRLCEEIRARDNDPPCRDEQRAWYDTLRDFLPSIKGLEPTVRLFSKEFKWCTLDPENPSDIEKFKSILKGT